MSLQIGKYLIATHTKQSASQQEIYHGLSRLCSMLQGTQFDWFLVGGIGTDLSLGRLTRTHSDIDIETDKQNAQQLIEQMKRHGYGFFRKVASGKILRNTLLTAYTESDDTNCETAQNYRFVKRKQTGIDDNNPLLSYIDIFFSGAQEDFTEIGYKNKTIKMTEPYSTKDMTVNINGNIIKLRNPAYHRELIKVTNYKKNPLNKTALDEILARETRTA